MIHVLLIVCFLSIYLHDLIGQAAWFDSLTPTTAAFCSLLPLIALGAGVHASTARLGRIVDRFGSWHAVARSHNIVRRARGLAVVIHVANITILGWLDAIRSIVGDVVLLDELLAVAPVLLTWTWGWWGLAPIERRVREATLLRDIESGRPTHAIPTRAQFVLSNVRFHVLLLLLPMAALLTWSESLDRLAPRWFGTATDPDTGLTTLSDAASAWRAGLGFLGVVVVFALMPLGLRIVWDVVPIARGPLLERLVTLCRRSRVRVGGLLVWRTHGLMLNGAVIGLFWPLRYILLTDALLDTLTQRQIEAVAAHEVGHIRKRHMLWLAATMLASIASIGAIVALIQTLVSIGLPLLTPGTGVGEALGVLITIGLAMVIFGYVSRRFEWQADAFAAATLSADVALVGTPPSASRSASPPAPIEYISDPTDPIIDAPALAASNIENRGSSEPSAAFGPSEHAADAPFVSSNPESMRFAGERSPTTNHSSSDDRRDGPDESQHHEASPLRSSAASKSSASPDDARRATTVTAESVEAMTAALGTVAAASGIPARAFSWRHGSIQTRQRRLASLVDRRIDRLPIDREVRRLKIAISAVGSVMLLLMAGGWLIGLLLTSLARGQG
jgi:STE24 endopeptidase